jgi:predicted RND superfamily exporter protein
MAVTVTLGVMMIAFGMTVIALGMIVIVRVLMIGLAAACQKQNSDKEGKKRLHSSGTLATLEPLGKPLKCPEPHFSRGHF